ncbi:2'-5' RNA ligase family protein [Roseomonas sp. SSH11]|uniref:2'-5' RNA ligase family protein n=1 Tax=Pararoseomonas baculiformis TaxID=2820812 RepID=A0ABS4ADV7_9PROT|nr:2'-5' RNA ligase family protein [Pararoseomonas baculiformis]MBP0445189.1 2'-5' RNA ligase family protein [Pararoseomonas baculiformis]
MTAPLILSLGFDPASFARLDGLRRAHFPADRNLIPAHLTLFHALPGEAREEIEANLATATAGTAPVALRMAGLRPLGRGVAIEVEAPALAALRRLLAQHWAGWLTRQDAQGWRPHVTIQNKVAPEAARSLLDELAQDFTPWEARGEALLLWHYRGGPWEEAAAFPFLG